MSIVSNASSQVCVFFAVVVLFQHVGFCVPSVCISRMSRHLLLCDCCSDYILAW